MGADGFLTLRAEMFDAVFVPTLQHLEYDLGYRLWIARDGALLWWLRNRNEWSWDAGPIGLEPGNELETYMQPMRVIDDPSPFRDNVDVARAIHEQSLELLPRGPVR